MPTNDSTLPAEWHEFSYDNKPGTAPPADKLVWIYEEYYAGGVTIGYFDGFTFRVWHGSDACSVTKWAPIIYPEAS